LKFELPTKSFESSVKHILMSLQYVYIICTLESVGK